MKLYFRCEAMGTDGQRCWREATHIHIPTLAYVCFYHQKLFAPAAGAHLLTEKLKENVVRRFNLENPS